MMEIRLCSLCGCLCDKYKKSHLLAKIVFIFMALEYSGFMHEAGVRDGGYTINSIKTKDL